MQRRQIQLGTLFAGVLIGLVLFAIFKVILLILVGIVIGAALVYLLRRR